MLDSTFNEAAGLAFLNADEIAAQLCPEAPESVAIRAGRMMLAQITEHLDTGKSFALETTLSGRGYARAIPKWRAGGYRVEMIFLRLPSPEIAEARVANRIIEGGHSIPPEDIYRRHEAGWKNFQQIYRPLVNSWLVYDSFETPPKLLSEGSNP